MDLGKFSLSVASTSSRKSSNSSVPTLIIIGGDVPNKFRLNEGATELMGIKPGDKVVLLSNKAAIIAAAAAGDPDLLKWAEDNNTVPTQYPITWAIAKGYPLFDSNGSALTEKVPLTNALEAKLREEGMIDEETGKVIAPDTDRIFGARLASSNKSAGIGAVCEFTDSSVWDDLRLEAEQRVHVLYGVDKTPIKVPAFNGFETIELTAFPIEFKDVEEIQARGRSASNSDVNSAAGDESVNEEQADVDYQE